MQNYQTLIVRIVANAGNLQPFQYATYYGTLTRNSAASFYADLSCGLDEIHGEYANNAWSWIKEPTRAEVDALNSKVKQTAWGTTLDITTPGTINGILLIGDTYLVRVWMPATHDVSVTVETTQGIYRKTGTDTVSFGTTSTDTAYTLTRTGVKSFTVTASTSVTLTWIGY